VEIIKEVVRTEIVRESVPTTNYNDVDVTTNYTDVSEVQNQATEQVIVDDAAASRADRGLYYIIIGSSYNYAQAYDFWNKWLSNFSGAEILEYGNGLYRIGYYAGNTEEAAVRTYNEAKKIKKDVWVLRPKS
jgi:hypothetical protein